ncbi:MAG: hypothetical protein JWN04_6536 [Myxococcaceae bacterium]|nr:hypothetical protein [Myxococcaceae bacterium]
MNDEQFERLISAITSVGGAVSGLGNALLYLGPIIFMAATCHGALTAGR